MSLLNKEELTSEEIKLLKELYKKYAVGSSMGFPLREAAQDVGMSPEQLEESLLKLKRKGVLEELVLPVTSNRVNAILEDALSLEFQFREGAIAEAEYRTMRSKIEDSLREVSRVEVLDSVMAWFGLEPLLERKRTMMEKIGTVCTSRQVKTEIAADVYEAIIGELNEEFTKIQRDLRRLGDEVWEKVDNLLDRISEIREGRKLIVTKHELGVMSKADVDKELKELDAKVEFLTKLCVSLLKLVSVPLVESVAASQELGELKKRELDILNRIEELSREEERVGNEIDALEQNLEREGEVALTEQQQKSEIEKLQERIRELDVEHDELVKTRDSLQSTVKKSEEFLISLEAEYLMGRISAKRYQLLVEKTNVELQKAREDLDKISSRVLQVEDELLKLDVQLKDAFARATPEVREKVANRIQEMKNKLQSLTNRLDEIRVETNSKNAELAKVREEMDTISKNLPKEIRPDLNAFIKKREEEGVWADRHYDSKCLTKESYDFFISCIRSDIFQAEKLKAYQALLVVKKR